MSAVLNTYEVLAALHALPDKAALNTAEAAVFLRLSQKTLERMRMDGSGPAYIQGGRFDARGTNQKCTYLKEDLLMWQKANQVTNVMQAATKKGQTFATVFDLVSEIPFYLDDSSRVDGAIDNTPLDVIVARLGTNLWQIVWLSAADAAARPWSSLANHREFAGSVSQALSQNIQKIEAALVATELWSGISKND